MVFYAYLDSSNVVTGVYALPSAITADGYVEITEQQYNDSQAGNENSLIGKVYNPETGEFEAPIPWSGSSDQVQYKDTTKSVSTKLDEIDADIAALENASGSTIDAYTKIETDALLDTKADTTDLHTHDNKTVLDGITAAKITAWDAGASGAGTPGADGEDGATFTPSVSSAGVISWTNDKGLTNPTPVNIKGADGQNGADGEDGVSPTVSVSKSGTVTTITITDVNGTHTATINDGADGADGESGAEITAAQVLEKLLTVDGQNSGLDADKLDGHDADYFATATQLESKAAADHNHDTAYAPISHTHSGYAETNHTHTGYAAATHTHSMDDVTGLSSALSGKASTDHTHSGYAASNHTHSGYASTNHTHSEYASTSHTHSGYASSDHTHTTFSSAINVSGAIKSNGVQGIYNDGSDTTLGSNSYATVVAGTQVTLNGTKAYAPNIYPRNTGSFDLGAQSNRWSNIYSKTALNVSSDRRLKENIKPIDEHEAEELIKNIPVCNFNYIGSDDECIGVIAQDINEISPEIAKTIVTQDENGYYGVKTSDLVFPLIKYVQILTKRIEQLENNAE